MDKNALRFMRMLLIGLLLGWAWCGNAQGAEDEYSALAEKYGLSPGMKITKENVHLIKELVPEAFYKRVESGDYGDITIGKFDPPDILTKVFPPELYQASEQNMGKYDLDEDGGIIDKATGKRPWPMPYGMPFPRPDLKDPKAGTKIQWNAVATGNGLNEFGPGPEGAQFSTFSPRGGADRSIQVTEARQFTEFRQDPVDLDRQLHFQDIFFFLKPAESFGTAILTWRWADPKKWDSVWTYSPAIRRIRRVTAANRSDPLLGMEVVQDDSNLYSGKVEMMEWKYIEKRAMLMPFLRTRSQGPEDLVVRAPIGTMHDPLLSQVPTAYTSESKVYTFAADETPQQYVSWWQPGQLWVVVPAYVIDMTPKDPNYNYGRQILWYEANTFAGIWKLIYNRSGEYWRTMLQGVEYLHFKGPDKVKGGWTTNSVLAADEKSNRGVSLKFGDKGGFQYNAGWDTRMFTLENFLNFGK
jgi:hypothetical protein